MLTTLSLWWFDQLADLVPNHVVSTDVPAEVAGRAMICRRLEMFPVECVARGYLTGSGLAEYEVSGSVTGIELPRGAGRRVAAADADLHAGHQGRAGRPRRERASSRPSSTTVGPENAAALRDLTLAVYARAEEIARSRGVILADTKLEFGTDPVTGAITLGDEVLTPGLLAVLAGRRVGAGPRAAAFDKQFVRDWLTSAGVRVGPPLGHTAARAAAGRRRPHPRPVPRGVRAADRVGTRPVAEGPMRAVVIESFGVAPTVRDVPVPTCPDDGVVLRVTATGVCRSDWHAWQGHDSDVTLPHVPGHELAGVVVATGPAVTRWAVGDAVTVPFVCACGTCAACLAGEHQVCERQRQPGFTDDGSFAEYVALHHADVNLVRLPDGMSPVIAAGLGCRFATAYRALTVHGRVGPGDWVAVHGCGGVGLSAVMIAVAAGAQVVATDVSPAGPRRRARHGGGGRPRRVDRPGRGHPRGDGRRRARLDRRPRQHGDGDRVDPVAAASRPARPGRSPAGCGHRAGAARWAA